jgi:hypothetical protein
MLVEQLASAFPRRSIETTALALTASSGATLQLGWAGRIAS